MPLDRGAVHDEWIIVSPLEPVNYKSGVRADKMAWQPRCLLLRPGDLRIIPGARMKVGEKVTLGSCPLASIQVPLHMSPHNTHSTHTHTDDDVDDDLE